jgi:hypothetical protein
LEENPEREALGADCALVGISWDENDFAQPGLDVLDEVTDFKMRSRPQLIPREDRCGEEVE